MKKVILFLFGLVLITSCTENQQAKRWGGTASITLPKNRKLVNATWKDSNLWYLTRPMNKNEKAETYYLKILSISPQFTWVKNNLYPKFLSKKSKK